MKDIILRKLMQTDISFGEMEEFENYLNDLEEDRKLLYALQAADVDNWSWYGEAMRIYHEEEEEEE